MRFDSIFSLTSVVTLVGMTLSSVNGVHGGGGNGGVPKFQYGTPSGTASGVISEDANGPTNPSKPSLGTPINQSSMARLLSINSVDDWCTFSSPNGEIIADVEGETVAYCVQQRNNARVMPDGTVTAAHFVKTPLYVQIMALGDFTKIGVKAGDEGGELDPHGATGLGNPVGGNVTSNVTGVDVFYSEWMNYISYNQVCLRVCIAGSDEAPTPLECQHTLDEMGCEWVMPGDYSPNGFDSCEGDAAYPPGLYPQEDGSTSTFQQYYSSVYTAPDGSEQTWVHGTPDQQTPQAAYSLPSTSSCTSFATISNGINALLSYAGPPSSTSTSSSSSSMTTITSSSSSSMITSTSSSSSSSQNVFTGSTQNSENTSSNETKTGSSSNLNIPTILTGTLIALIASGAAFLN